jgi:hypothetical protein
MDQTSVDSTPIMGEPERAKAQSLTLSRLRPPLRIPGYEQERYLGRGAFGEVWVAVNSNNGRKVAVKYYHRRGGLDWSLLSREVEKLRHLFGDRHIVQLLEVGWESDPPYYLMEYMEKGSLEDLLSNGPLPVELALAFLHGIATGLVHAHGKGILHCDLKPANVMLDQDGQPRLADFGQSRLTHEHSPALGTLFYMAPEQADLKANPDARWNVYALGAVLYRMLTLDAPYRTPKAVAAIQAAGTLEERLERYRQWLSTAPRPAAHRAVRDVDSELAAIIDRCLAVNPHNRYANVQAVLSALNKRAVRRARRPLLILGGAGPLLVMLVVLVVAGWQFYDDARTAKKEVIKHAIEADRLAAQVEAERLGAEVRTRWMILEHEANDPALVECLKKGAPPFDEMNQWLRQAQKRWDKVAPASLWVIDDRDGYQQACSEPDPNKPGGYMTKRSMLNLYYGYRTYFHGEDLERPEKQPPADAARRPTPIKRNRSAVIRRTSSKTWAVAFTVPIREQGSQSPIGLLGMMKELVGPVQHEGDRIIALVDTRPDQTGRPGVILSHPYQKAFVKDPSRLTLYYSERKPVAATAENYQDPVSLDGYAGKNWLAAMEPVRVPNVEPELADTGWLIVVQEDQEKVVAPIMNLGGKIAWAGGLAVLLVAAVLALMWGFVMVVLNEAPGSRTVKFLRRHLGLHSGASASGASGAGSSPSGSTPSEARPSSWPS